MGNLMVNLDNSFFFAWHSHEEMTSEGVDAFVDQYADTQVTDLQFCPNSQRSSVDCTSRQTVWDGYDPEADTGQPFFSGVPDEIFWPDGPNARDHMRNWVHGCWLLHSRRIDPYALWIARARSHGIRCWISMRMNDVHYVDQPDHCIHDRFWKNHREFRRDPDNDPYNGHCFDYGRPEVRDYQLAYVREMIFRYDMDGFELDWMRNPYYFRPGHETEGTALLTEFIVEVRRLLDERAGELGHPIRLSVRVPAHPDTALALGFDVATWTRRGLVDTVVVSSFLWHEFDVPMEIWRAMLAETDVILAAGMMSALRGCGKARAHNLETARGGAASLLDRGADSISLFNFFDNHPYGSVGEAYRLSETAHVYGRALRELGSLDVLLPLSRRHVVTPGDTFAPGQPVVAPLPAETAAGQRAEFRIHTGPIPGEAQRARVRLGLEEVPGDSGADWRVMVNDALCAPVGKIAPPPGGTVPTLAFEIPAGTLRRGHNLVRVINDSATHGRVTWVEIALSNRDGHYPADGVEVASMFPQ